MDTQTEDYILQIHCIEDLKFQITIYFQKKLVLFNLIFISWIVLYPTCEIEKIVNNTASNYL